MSFAQEMKSQPSPFNAIVENLITINLLATIGTIGIVRLNF